jgi:hypothetical protein
MLSIDQNGIANVGTDLLFLTSFEAATVYMSTHIRHHFVTALSSLFRLHHPARKTFRSPELQVVRLGESSKPQRLKGKGWHAAAAVSREPRWRQSEPVASGFQLDNGSQPCGH